MFKSLNRIPRVGIAIIHDHVSSHICCNYRKNFNKSFWTVKIQLTKEIDFLGEISESSTKRNEKQDNHDHLKTVKQTEKSIINENHASRVSKYSRQSGRSKSLLPEVSYEDYITHEECRKGLENGELVQGVLKINSRSHKLGFIDGTKAEEDICIDGLEMRNRALHNDVVVVQILPQDQWKNGKKRGKVVHIIERKHPRVCAGHLAPFRSLATFGLFTPIDKRVPRFMIPLSDCPKDFIIRPRDYEKTLFLARFVEWGMKIDFASGAIVRNLGEAGDIEPETEAILCANDIDSSDFDDDVLQCLPDGEKWKVTNTELLKRKDLREECIFSIDPATARDLDDALSCKKIGDDLFEVGVHIADVSHFVEQDNALDKVAKSRATSVYLAQKVIPMLPNVLSEQLCSLNPGVERLAYSVIWNLKSDGTIVKEWFGRTVINSCVKLSYDHAQQMIEGEITNLNENEFPPIQGKFSLQKIAGIVKNLYAISADLRKNRFDSGALTVDLPKLSFTLDDQTGMPSGCQAYEYKNSNEMIEEFMLLANMSVARKISKAHPKISILRNHPPPVLDMLQEVEELCKALDIPFDMKDSKSINSSLNDILTSEKEGIENIYPALNLMCTKSFNLAKYFCTGSVSDDKMYHHYALNVPMYTHFTSPIRRYPDIMVHRLLTAALHRDYKVPNNVDELQKVSDHCNDKKWAAKDADEKSTLLFFALFVRECGPIKEKGVVISISENSINVLSLRLGIVYCIYTSDLAINKHDFKKNEFTSEMKLYWRDYLEGESFKEKLTAHKKGRLKQLYSVENEEEKECDGSTDGSIEQELKIFSPVDILLGVKESSPTKITATLLNPYDLDFNET